MCWRTLRSIYRIEKGVQHANRLSWSYRSNQLTYMCIWTSEVRLRSGLLCHRYKEQAVRWAQTMADKRNAQPLLNIYSLDRDAFLAECRHKIFTSYDSEWLEFIVANRRGENLAAAYDYVEGGIANDRVIDTVNLYIQGLVDSATALQQLAFYKPNNQICLLNQTLTDKYLHFYDSERI